MSHSRIFVLMEEDIIEESEKVHGPSYEELISVYPAADYIDDSNLDDDILWFKDVYKIEVKKKNGYYIINRQQFLDCLRKDTIKNIEKAKSLLNKKPAADITDTDIFEVVSLLQDKYSFLFYMDGILFTPAEFSRYLSDMQDDTLAIVASYDYHF